MGEVIGIAQKILLYACLLSVAGIVFARYTLPLKNARPKPPRLIPLFSIAGLLILASMLPVMIWRLGGDFSPAFVQMVLGNRLGFALGLLAAGTLLCLFSTSANIRALKVFTLPGAALIIAGFSLWGHASTTGGPSMVVVAIHLTAVSWWAGCLWWLHTATRRESRKTLAKLVDKFSGQAIWVISMLVIAGFLLLLSLTHWNLFTANPDYLKLFIVKLLALLPLAMLVGFNKWYLSPRLQTVSRAIISFRYSIRLELLLLLLVLMATGLLTSLASPVH